MRRGAAASVARGAAASGAGGAEAWLREEAERRALARRQMPRQLMEVSLVRCVGFRDAVERLGKHEICGTMAHYRPESVRKCLTGEKRSLKLLERMAEKAPELFGLRYVGAEVEAWARARGVDVDGWRRRVRVFAVADDAAGAEGAAGAGGADAGAAGGAE